MRWRIVGLATFFVAGCEKVDVDEAYSPPPPPAWMVRGFEAAIADPKAVAGAMRLDFSDWLLHAVPADRNLDVIDKLLPLLESSNSDVQAAAARAFAAIPPGERADEIIGKLLPLLRSSDLKVQAAAARAFAAIPPGERADEIIGKLLPLLGSPDDKVQAAAARAFAAIPPSERADKEIDELLPLFGSLDKVQAAQVFAALLPGDRAKVIEKLLSRLQSRDSDVKRDVAVSLTKIPPGDRAKEVIENLFALLRESDIQLQLVAAGALAAIPTGERADLVIDKLLPRLVWPDSDVQRQVAELLGKIPPGKRADLVIGKLLPLLESSTGRVRQAAAGALAAIPPGNRAKEVIGKLRPLLGSLDMEAQLAVAQTLMAIPLGDRSNEVIDILLQLVESSHMAKGVKVKEAIAAIPLGDRINELIDKLLARLGVPDRNAQWAAARVFAVIPPGERAKEVIGKLLPLLGSSDINVQWAAARAFAAIPLGDRAKEVIDKLLPLLSSSDENEQNAAAWALAQAGPGDARTAIAILGDINNQAATATPTLRAVAHIATGADATNEGSEVLLAWLGNPLAPPLASIANKPLAAHDVLKTFDRYWPAIGANAKLRQEAEGRVMDIVYAACRSPAEAQTLAQWLAAALAWIRDLPLQGPVQRCWSSEQRRTLEQLLDGFQEVGNKDALSTHLARENPAPILQWLTWGVAGWIVLWTVFLFAFPWSRTIQAVFFWNPKVRNMLSLWFVPLLLLCLPPLRRRLLIPFRDDLVATARLADLPRLAFFGQSRARIGDNPPTTLETVLQGLRNAVVLRGDAGLGKTSALRWLATRSTGPVAFLTARDCADGVDVAIARLIHDVQETGFVRSMVYAGTLTVIVDGLNEVSADIRAKIGAFVRDMSKGDVLVGTQPIEWKEPPGATIVDLLPLSREEAERFLLSRPVGTDAMQKVHGSAYDDAVRAFLRRALDEAPSEEDRQAAELVLSNPFDLAFAADLLAQGSKPSATALIDEAFRLADEGAPGEPGYRDVAGQPFPLTRFGILTVAMRLEDRNWFKPEEFAAELPCLLQRRLLVQHAVRGLGGVEERFQFRHDRVWDFFIAAAFLDDSDLWAEHLTDPRFRGAYLRIAETWEPEAAAKVLDRLNVMAAERGDHMTSDDFIKRLEARRRSRKQRGPRQSEPRRKEARAAVQGEVNMG
jgi:HEAT repeat protein